MRSRVGGMDGKMVCNDGTRAVVTKLTEAGGAGIIVFKILVSGGFGIAALCDEEGKYPIYFRGQTCGNGGA